MSDRCAHRTGGQPLEKARQLITTLTFPIGRVLRKIVLRDSKSALDTLADSFPLRKAAASPCRYWRSPTKNPSRHFAAN